MFSSNFAGDEDKSLPIENSNNPIINNVDGSLTTDDIAQYFPGAISQSNDANYHNDSMGTELNSKISFANFGKLRPTSHESLRKSHGNKNFIVVTVSDAFAKKALPATIEKILSEASNNIRTPNCPSIVEETAPSSENLLTAEEAQQKLDAVVPLYSQIKRQENAIREHFRNCLEDKVDKSLGIERSKLISKTKIPKEKKSNASRLLYCAGIEFDLQLPNATFKESWIRNIKKFDTIVQHTICREAITQANAKGVALDDKHFKTAVNKITAKVIIISAATMTAENEDKDMYDSFEQDTADSINTADKEDEAVIESKGKDDSYNTETRVSKSEINQELFDKALDYDLPTIQAILEFLKICKLNLNLLDVTHQLTAPENAQTLEAVFKQMKFMFPMPILFSPK